MRLLLNPGSLGRSTEVLHTCGPPSLGCSAVSQFDLIVSRRWAKLLPLWIRAIAEVCTAGW